MYINNPVEVQLLSRLLIENLEGNGLTSWYVRAIMNMDAAKYLKTITHCDKEGVQAIFWEIFDNDLQCILCGKRCPIVYHHVFPSQKEHKIADMRRLRLGYPIDKILDEMKKCVPLCNYHHNSYHQKKEGSISKQHDANKILDYYLNNNETTPLWHA